MEKTLSINNTIEIQKRWLILIPLCAFLLYDFIQLNMMGSMAHFLIESMQITPKQLGFISSLFFYINLALLFLAGTLLDIYPTKWLVIASLVIMLIGIIIFTITPSILTMVIWRSFSGVAGAFSYLSCIKILATYFPKRMIGLLIGLTGIVIMAGGVIAQAPLTFLLSKLGLTNTLWINMAVGLFVILLLMTLMPHSLHQPRSALPKKPANLSTVFLKKKNWIIALYACLTNFPLFVLGALWGNLYLKHVQGISLQAAALITSMIFIGNMLGAPLLGFTSDKMGNRKLLMIVSAVIMFMTTFIIMFMPFSQGILLLVLLFFILGISTGAQTLAYASVVDINEQNEIAKATSMLSFLSVGGGAVAQPLFGWIITLSPQINYENGMYIMLLASAIAVILSIYYKKL